MASILLDNDVAHNIADFLRSLGHDVVTASEIGKAAALDDEMLLLAARQRRIYVTHNGTPFALLHDAWQRWFRAYDVQPPPTHSGILIIPQPNYGRRYWLPNNAAREIDALLVEDVPLANESYRWSSSQGWVQRQPIQAET